MVAWFRLAGRGLMLCVLAPIQAGTAPPPSAVAAPPPPTPAATSPAPLVTPAPPLSPAAGSAVPPEAASALDPIDNVVVEAPEPKYVAPTLRDRIGRIWAPVLINGKGPYRLVLDTGASHSAIIGRVADSLGMKNQADNIVVRGVTGSAVVP